MSLKIIDVPNVILVPDFSAAELTDRVVEGLKLEEPRFGESFRSWDFYRGHDGTLIPGRNEKFEVRVFELADMSFLERRAYCETQGFPGHVGAFLWWRLLTGFMGWHATLPEDNACRWHGPDPDKRSIPFTVIEGEDRRLGDAFLLGGGRPHWHYAGFKRLSA